MIPLMQLGEICEFESDVFNYFFFSLACSSLHISIHLHFYHVLFFHLQHLIICPVFKVLHSLCMEVVLQLFQPVH